MLDEKSVADPMHDKADLFDGEADLFDGEADLMARNVDGCTSKQSAISSSNRPSLIFKKNMITTIGIFVSLKPGKSGDVNS